MIQNVILISTLLASPLALAKEGGDVSGGGADDYQILPAFFRSYNPGDTIEACMEVAPDFGIEPSQIAVMIQNAFKQWSAYIPANKLNIVPSSRKIVTSLSLHLGCAGSENLAFYMGIENELVGKYKSQFSHPFGFAQLTQEGGIEYSGQLKAKGFIWIAPNGSIDATKSIPKWGLDTREALAGLILHEIGHVFGNGHVDGTVMTEKIGKYLEEDTNPAQPFRKNLAYYSKIDSQIELVPCMECRRTYLAAETFDELRPPNDPSASDWILTFKLLTGREPVAPMVIRYERLGSPQGSGKLTLMDSLGSEIFPVNVISIIGERQDSTPLFNGQGDTTFYSFGVSYFAKIKPLNGDSLPVAVNYNMDGKKAQILPLNSTDFYPRPLFVSAP